MWYSEGSDSPLRNVKTDPGCDYQEEHRLVLNLHGEMTGSPPDVTTLNAEAKFIPQLHKLHQAFPRLRIGASFPAIPFLVSYHIISNISRATVPQKVRLHV